MSTQQEMLIVGCGGFLGAISRFKLGNLILQNWVYHTFPLGTFTINIIGCFLIGLVGGLAEKYQLFSQDIRLFITVGFLGGFTTFSSFGFESVYLIKKGHIITTLFYIVASVVVGLLFVWIGWFIATKAGN